MLTRVGAGSRDSTGGAQRCLNLRTVIAHVLEDPLNVVMGSGVLFLGDGSPIIVEHTITGVAANSYSPAGTSSTAAPCPTDERTPGTAHTFLH
jgi:hypothetical protein